jgi:ornithine carbamoyltransferase
MPKDFVSIAEWSADELWGMLDRAAELKTLNRRGERPQTLAGRALAMFFEKPSLRTHVTFEAGMTQLGGDAILLHPEQVGIGSRESAADVARNLSRWVDGLVARTFSHAVVEELAEAATIPVINGLTDLLHPCQVMADFQTVAERTPLKDAAIAYVGDGFNMAHSLMLGAAVLGLELRLATPATHRPAARIREWAESLAVTSGAKLSWSEDPREAVAGSDIVYTDVWTSMGQEEESARRRKLFAPYQVNA